MQVWVELGIRPLAMGLGAGDFLVFCYIAWQTKECCTMKGAAEGSWRKGMEPVCLSLVEAERGNAGAARLSSKFRAAPLLQILLSLRLDSGRLCLFSAGLH